MIDETRLTRIRRASLLTAVVGFVGFLVLIGVSAYEFREIRREIARTRGEIDLKRQELAELESDIVEKQQRVQELSRRIDLLSSALSTVADRDSGLARDAVAQALASDPEAANVVPRVYIHIPDESRRPLAKRVAEQLQRQGFLVPGVENVGRAKSPRTTDVRYFRDSAVDREEAGGIVRIVRELAPGATGQLVPGYEGSPLIRPRHYEIWFGTGG